MLRFFVLRKLLLLIILLTMLSVGFPAYAATFTVNTSGEAPDTALDGVCDTSAAAGLQCTLRAAIQEANSVPGDDIIDFSITTVNGRAFEAVSSNITFNGVGITVNAGGIGAALNIFSGTVIINGLTLTGGLSSAGSGLFISGVADVTVQNGAKITGNTANNGAGGVVVQLGATVTFTGAGTEITDNTSNQRIGAMSISASTVRIENGAVVSGNRSLGIGGVGRIAGGIYVTNNASLTVDNATISNNTADTDGGGIYINLGSVTLQNGAVITENTATNGSGGGIYVASATANVLNVSGSRITFNTASGDGDAVYRAGSGSVTVGSSCIVCNGDNAMDLASGTMSLGDNWWGSPWGPYHSSSNNGLECSTGDSLDPANPLAQYGITLTTSSPSCSVMPTGNWRTITTAGCTGTEASTASSLGHNRTCVTPP